MRVLYIDSAELIHHVKDALCLLGYEYDELSGFDFGAEYDEKQLRHRIQELISIKNANGKCYQMVFSFNYYHVISEVCRENDIIYICWIYDSPQAELFHPTIGNTNNRIFVFDKMLIKRLKAYKPDANLFYMPLAGNTDQLGSIFINEEDEKIYNKDISFVGGLYENNVYNQTWNNLSEEQRDELGTYLMANLCNWKYTRKWPELSDEFVDLYIKMSERGRQLCYDMKPSEYYGCMVLSRKLAEMERITILNRLSEVHPLCLYTNSKSQYIKTVNGDIKPPVDYRSDMFKVFHLSRINLNITLPSIETGVPLRVFDILSVGGFCLTNESEEVFELFEVGKEIETYDSLEELIDKSLYYLRHEERRKRIGVNGYLAVKERHNYVKRLGEMIETAI